MKISKAVSSELEASYLYSALADFGRNGARAEYAAWLDAQGDRERAGAVRATIHAFHNLDKGPLEGLALDPDWERMIAIPLLQALIQAKADHSVSALRRLRDLAFPRIRPALSLSYAPTAAEPARGSSYLWGLPDIPETEQWPRISEVSDWFGARSKLPQDLHCAFLGQICFSELRGSVLGQEIPAGGGCSIFCITEVHKLGVVETLVRPWDNTAPLKRSEPPQDLLEDPLGDTTNRPKTPHAISLGEDLSLPDASWGPFSEEIPDCKFEGEFHHLYAQLRCACQEDAGFNGHGISFSNKEGFGGYLRGTTGADPSPDTKALRFAVLPTNPDGGRVHFSIPSAGFRTGNLKTVQYVWCDWD